MNYPKIRFQEFSDSWQSKKLGDFTVFTKGKNISKSDITQNGDYECIRYGELYTHYNEVIDIIKSRTSLPFEQLLFSKANDIIIPSSGETAIDIATASCVLKDNVALGGDLNILRTAENGVFLAYYLNSAKRQNISSLAQGNSVVHLYAKQLKDLNVNIPNRNEQNKIADFLLKVDTRITFLKEKKTLLEQYKKAVMQKIFSQELRFKDENGDEFNSWQETTLGEIGTFQTSSIDKLTRDNEKKIYLVNYMNVYRHENINRDTVQSFQIVTAKDSQISSCSLKKGDILFTPSSETPSDIGHSVVIFEDLPNAVFSYHLMRFRPSIEINTLFSHYFCNTTEILKQLSKLATGSTRFTISVKSFSSIKVKLPSLGEQKQISSFLKILDEKIFAIENQIKESEKWKKGLLQKMFV